MPGCTASAGTAGPAPQLSGAVSAPFPAEHAGHKESPKPSAFLHRLDRRVVRTRELYRLAHDPAPEHIPISAGFAYRFAPFFPPRSGRPALLPPGDLACDTTWPVRIPGASLRD